MRFFRFGLGTRIAITMLVALFIMQGMTGFIFSLLPRPHDTIYSARWLITQATTAATEMFATDVSKRQELARTLSATMQLDVHWHADRRPPFPEPPHGLPSPALRRLETTLRQDLGQSVKEVGVDEMVGMPGGGPGGDPIYMPPQQAPSGRTDALSANEPDLHIIGRFRIRIEGADGSVLNIEPARPEFMMPFMQPEILVGAATLLLGALLSAWTAKRALAPIDYLVAASARLGVERHAHLIETKELGDFAVIGVAINEMQTRIKGFVDERTQMLAAVSHDLRTLLTRLRLNIEELSDGEEKTSLIRNVEEMEQMIAATLTFADDDLKKERSERVDIAAMIITICDGFSDMGANVRYQGPDHAETVCQTVAIKRVFFNVIDNAIKYGGEADVELTLLADALRVTVADRGPGIPPQFIDHAFKPFTRLEQSRNRTTGGVGLGLAIVRDILAAHGGSIQLGPRQGGGLCVTMNLALRPSSVKG